MTARERAVELAVANGWEVTQINQMVNFVRPEAYATAHFDRAGKLIRVYAGTEKDENGVFKRSHTLKTKMRHKIGWLSYWLVVGYSEKVG